MVNKALAGTLVAAGAALILMLAAFIVPQWQSRIIENTDAQTGDVTTTTWKIGLSDMEFDVRREDANGNLITDDNYQAPLSTDGNIEYTHQTPTSSSTTTITPPQSTQTLQTLGQTTFIQNSMSARTNVEGSGIPAFMLGCLFLTLVGVNRAGKGPPWLKQIAVLVCVLTAVLTFLGVFLYAKVLNIGYSFIIWAGFGVFTLLAAIFTGIPTGRRAKFLPVACLLLALTLGIVAMATTSWFSEVDDNTVGGTRIVTTSNAGLKAYSVESQVYDASGQNVQSTTTISSTFSSDEFTESSQTPTGSNSQTYTKCPTTPNGGRCYDATDLETGLFKDFIKGGNEVLGCGIPALIFAVVALVAVGTILRTPPQHAKLIAIGFAVAASALGFLGLFLYAAVSSVGVSFVLYSAAGFLWVLASCMAFSLLNPMSGGGGGQPAKEEKPTPTPSTSSGSKSANTTAEV